MDTQRKQPSPPRQDLLETTQTSLAELESNLEHIKSAPKNQGSVELIVCRPSTGKRRELEQGELCPQRGLVGDNWLTRGDYKRPGGQAHPDMQLNLMNARAISAIARDKRHWKLAGDQFFVDMDLSPTNLPAGTRLQIGSALIEVTAEPHLGCKKFLARFGKDAAMFVNSKIGKSLNLRGINASVIEPGVVKPGDAVLKLA